MPATRDQIDQLPPALRAVVDDGATADDVSLHRPQWLGGGHWTDDELTAMRDGTYDYARLTMPEDYTPVDDQQRGHSHADEHPDDEVTSARRAIEDHEKRIDEAFAAELDELCRRYGRTVQGDVVLYVSRQAPPSS